MTKRTTLIVEVPDYIDDTTAERLARRGVAIAGLRLVEYHPEDMLARDPEHTDQEGYCVECQALVPGPGRSHQHAESCSLYDPTTTDFMREATS